MVKNMIPQSLLDEIKEELEHISYGSIEIYVQDNKVTQITVRNIKKTNTRIEATHSETLQENGNGHRLYTNGQSKIRVLTIQK